MEDGASFGECRAEVLNHNARGITHELRDFRQYPRRLVNIRRLLFLPPYTLPAERETQLLQHPIQFFIICWHLNVPFPGWFYASRALPSIFDANARRVNGLAYHFHRNFHVNFSKFQPDLPD